MKKPEAKAAANRLYLQLLDNITEIEHAEPGEPDYIAIGSEADEKEEKN